KFSQRLGDARVQAIGACDALEWNPQTALLHFLGVFEDPAGMDGEYVVGVPKHVRVVTIHQPFGLFGCGLRRAAAVRFSVDRVAAPTAVVRATTSGDHRDRS